MLSPGRCVLVIEREGQWPEFKRFLFCFLLNCNFSVSLENIDLEMKHLKPMRFFDVLEKCNLPEGKGGHCGCNGPLFASLSLTSLQ